MVGVTRITYLQTSVNISMWYFLYLFGYDVSKYPKGPKSAITLNQKKNNGEKMVNFLSRNPRGIRQMLIIARKKSTTPWATNCYSYVSLGYWLTSFNLWSITEKKTQLPKKPDIFKSETQ